MKADVEETSAVRLNEPKRFHLSPHAEIVVAAAALAIGVASYLYISKLGTGLQLLTPSLVALVLVANLLAGAALIVLLGRRFARRRAIRTGTGDGQLHVRLVAIFSILACIPTVLLAVTASLLFQYGAEFWFSGQARSILNNSQRLAVASYAELLRYVDDQNVAVASDIHKMLFENRWRPDDPKFKSVLLQSIYIRSLSGALLFTVSPKGEVIPVDVVKNSDQNFVQEINHDEFERVRRGAQSVSDTTAQQTHSLTRVEGTDLYLYVTREGGAQQMAARLNNLKSVFRDYQGLLKRARHIQLRFNLALLVISLLIIAIVVFVALAVADRLVRPVGELVTAARRVAGGDLTARVSTPPRADEIGTLAAAFNRMTERLESQTGALVSANDQLESRRALIEAVMSGVSAGVILVSDDRTIRLINASAIALLRAGEAPVGRPLAAVAPELDALIDDGTRDAIVQVETDDDTLTLAVKIARVEAGPILTFDDITQQQLDQRRAAWSDVARRIAHEIKNPLTPIQLAAERLQRRYGRTIEPEGGGTFQQLTETIVRQVGDLRRMVDEFSSFARMPKPMFAEESLVELGRQAMFLHEVAHPEIEFVLHHDDTAASLVCDRRQIGQALTNIVKNAVEAIQAKAETSGGRIEMTIREGQGETEGRFVTLVVADNGAGLPRDRERIVEPYMTTRARGTGLGLAIVKKIVEEHFGTIAFDDREGGGTLVTLSFDRSALARCDRSEDDGTLSDASPSSLQRIRSA